MAGWIWPPDPRFAQDDAEDPAGADLTWAYRWPAGSALAAALPALADCAGRRVLDIGCGRGELAVAALLAGAAEVCACDGSQRCLDHLEAAIAANHAGGRLRCRRHRWGEPLPDGPWDLVVGGDVLYRDGQNPALLRSVASGLAPGGVGLLSDLRRTPDADLAGLAAAAGLRLDWQVQPGGWSLARLTPSPAGPAAHHPGP